MYKVRNGVFETNSSSTHAVVIPHEVSADGYSKFTLTHDYCFGREESRMVTEWNEKLAYTYYVLLDFKNRYQKFLKIKNEVDYGCSYPVTDDDINNFKQKIIEIYNELPGDEYMKKDEVLTVFDVVEVAMDSSSMFGGEVVLPKEDGSLIVACPVNEKASLKIRADGEIVIRYFEDRDLITRLATVSDVYFRDPTEMDEKKFRVLQRYFECPEVYVDHTESFHENGFVDKIIHADKKYLKKFIFNHDAYITIGGDEYRGYNIKGIGFEYDYNDHHYVNEKGEEPPKEWFTKDGRIKKKYWNKYDDEYNKDGGTFWNKLREYEEDNDVFLKGN